MNKMSFFPSESLMRTLITTACFLLSIATGVACAADTEIISHAGKTILTFDLPSEWSVHPAKDTHAVARLDTPEQMPHIEVVRIADDLKTARNLLIPSIEAEVTHVSIVSENPLTIAGKHGTHIVITGNEADDNDPSNAEAYLFTTVSGTFLLLAHAEDKGAERVRSQLRSILSTAK
jgi:hypothetical protein